MMAVLFALFRCLVPNHLTGGVTRKAHTHHFLPSVVTMASAARPELSGPAEVIADGAHTHTQLHLVVEVGEVMCVCVAMTHLTIDPHQSAAL